jgi:hypothetical protein
MSNTLNIIGDIFFGSGMLLLAISNYLSIIQVGHLERKFQDLNVRVKSLETSRYYHETKIQTESQENEQGC